MYPTQKAHALIALGRYGEAWVSLQEEIADEAHQFARMVRDLCAGRYFLDLMDCEKAAGILRQVLDEATRLRRWRFAVSARLLLATAWIRAEQLEPAARIMLAQDLTRIREDPPAEPSHDVSASVVMAELFLSEGRLDEALRLTEASAARAERIGLGPACVSAFVVQLRLLLRLQRPGDAVALADRALRLAEEMSYNQMLWRIRAARAQARKALGDEAGASEDHQAAATVIRTLAQTVPDEELRNAFTAKALGSSIITGAPERS
jgi:hypothetical protein